MNTPTESRSLPLVSCTVVLLAALAILAHAQATAAEPAAPAAPVASDAAPKAARANDRRSDHYRLRAICVAQANGQGLKGEAHKLHVQRCLTTPAPR